MKANTIAISINSAVDNYVLNNPDFDLLTFDFFDPKNDSIIKDLRQGELKEYGLQQLMTLQRLMRIYNDRHVADILLEEGLDSAHRITAMPRHRFSGLLSSKLNTTADPDTANKIYDNASAVNAKVKHVFANLHSMVASPHYSNALFNNISDSLQEYTQQIPSYQDLFGTLDYCSCEHCRSVLSPAAYFLDIMRITDDYITDPNSTTIPTGMRLETRRPDLFNLLLTCDNTNDPLPFLQIVNKILETRLAQDLVVTTGQVQAAAAGTVTLASNASSENNAYVGMYLNISSGTGVGQVSMVRSYDGATKVATLTDNWKKIPDTTSVYTICRDIYQVLAMVPYPFNLPFHLPLSETRLYLQQLNTTLAGIYTTFLHPLNNGIARTGTTTTIQLADASSSVDSAYNYMRVEIAGGKGQGQARTIMAYTGSSRTATVDAWDVVPDNTSVYYITGVLNIAIEELGLSVEEYQLLLPPAKITGESLSFLYGYTGLSDTGLLKVLTPLHDFLYRTGLDRKTFMSLIVQELSQQELTAGIAKTFFINDTGENLSWLQIGTATDEKGNTYEIISNLSIKRLDRLNRFIRLQQCTGWEYADMDWLMKSFGQAEITVSFIQQLAATWQLPQNTQLSPLALCSFWSNIKTTGRISDKKPVAFFDTIFNNPVLLKGRDPYNSTDYIPFNPNVAQAWNINDYTGLNAVIRSRLKAALNINDNDLSLLAVFVYSLVTVNRTTPALLPLSLSNLTWLYRISKLASLYKLSINDCLLLLSLMYFPQAPDYKTPPAGILTGSLALLTAVGEKMTWLKTTQFTIPQLQFILTALTQSKFNKGFNVNALFSFVAKLAVLAEGSRLNPASFVYDDIDQHDSAIIFEKMRQQGMINTDGVTLKKMITYKEASTLLPVSQTAFVSKNISAVESLVIFNLLAAQNPAILTDVYEVKDTKFGLLSSDYTPYTPLDFLFKSKGSGQQNTISNYDGTTLTATVANPWNVVPDYTSWYQVIATKVSGTATGGTIDTITLTTAGSDKDYTGMTITITGGTGKDQVRKISSYTINTRIATVDQNWETIPDNTSTYAITLLVDEGLAQAGTANTIILAADSPVVSGAYNNMQINIIDYPKAAYKRNLVKAKLQQCLDNILQVGNIFANSFALQNKNALEELSAFLHTSPQLLSLLLPFSASAVDLADYLEALLTPIPANSQDIFLPFLFEESFFTDGLIDVTTSKATYAALINHQPSYLIAALILPGEKPRAGVAGSFTASTSLDFLFDGDAQAALKRERVKNILLLSQRAGRVNTLVNSSARALMVVTVLNLSVSETFAIFNMPSCCNISDLKHMSLDNIQSISAYKQLIIDLNDNSDALINYFNIPKDGNCAGLKISTLASITGWDPAQLCRLIKLFWPLDDVNDQHGTYNAVAGINRLMKCFNLNNSTGININNLLNLYDLQGLPLTKTTGEPDSLNWLKYTQAAATVKDNLNASIGDEAFATLIVKLNKTIDTDKRNALLGYTIWTLNKTFTFIKEPSDLYQFLLIDVEMSACDSVSLIAQGIASVQLYMQRCRMMLEEGVVDLSNIPEIWWSWMTAYRVWEANRKIFLYPENYVEPALRTNQTTPFKQFAESLLQTNINDEAVSQSFLNYFDDFSQLANLNYCDAYNCMIDKGTMTPPEKQTFFFARTNTAPYTFYYRIYYPDSNKWEQWEQINLTISAFYITPVFAYNRLFITWTERDTINSQKIAGGSTTDERTAYRANICYAYYDQHKAWVQAQGINRVIVEDYSPSTYGDGLYIDPSLINPDDLYWQKTYALQVPAKTIPGTPEIHYPERVMVVLGALYSLPVDKVGVPAPPSGRRNNPDQFDFENSIYETIVRVNAMIDNQNSRTGKIFLNNAALLFPTLDAAHSHLVIIDYDELEGSPRPYKPGMDLTGATLNVMESDNIIYDNYFAEYVNRPVGGLRTELASNFQLPALLPSNETPFQLLYNINTAKGNIITIKNQPGWFIYDNGDVQFLLKVKDEKVKTITEILIEINNSISGLPGELDLRCGSYTDSAIVFSNLNFTLYRLSTDTIQHLSQTLFLNGIDGLLSINNQELPELPVSRFYKDGTQPSPHLVIPDPAAIDKLDFNGAYGLYFWEIFFYSPFLVADSLRINQRFEEAMNWYQYIFNPTQQPDGTEKKASDRFWRFLPFRDMSIQTLIETLSDPAAIKAYNDHPFDPDAIASLRPVAYAKAIVMKYIDNLLTWGDFLFAQDTRESITQATNLYVMAADLLGRRPEEISQSPTPKPQSFNDIRASYDNVTIATGTVVSATSITVKLAADAAKEKDAYTGMYIEITDGAGKGESVYIIAYDGITQTATQNKAWGTNPDATSKYRIYQNGIPQFFIHLENSAFMNGGVTSNTAFNSTAFNDIPAYFCVPENTEFTAYWDKVEDRLYKIRHCQNLQGIERPLALFAPPIDPRQLIRAAAAGGGLSLSNQLEPQIPFYRFSFMLEKARSITSLLMQFGASLLAALEKKDAEALSLLRNTQEQQILALTTFNKQQQINELITNKAALNESRQSAKLRETYYSNLVKDGLSAAEIINIEGMTAAMVFNSAAAIVKTMASVGYALPNVGSPFAMTYGGQQIGSAVSAASAAIEIGSVVSSFVAQLSLTIAGYQRREQEWNLQQQLAGYDYAQIGYQLASNDISSQIAAQDLKIHLEAIRQNEETEAYLKDKFTNEELYQWMVTRLSTVYFQTYNLAVNLARSAQRAYQYELNSDISFVNFGYWDTLQKGLLAGEGVMLALEQMGNAYVENNIRTFEIEKTISLAQLDPKALLDFINTGECIFGLSEKLFDDDYPGHYARKIKSVSISVPAVVGPYQNIKAILTQLSNQIVITENINAVNFLLGGDEAEMPDTSVLRSNWWVNQQIALSSGVNDDGLFELNFNDERYLPFEGTGAVSTWRLSMPKGANRFDFSAISDVIIQLKYTARNGGSTFRDAVLALPAMKVFDGSSLINLAQAYPTAWNTFMHVHPDDTTQQMLFPIGNIIPPHIKQPALTGFFFQLNVPAGTVTTGGTGYITLALTDTISVTFNLNAQNSIMHTFDWNIPVSTLGQLSLSFNLANTPPALKTNTTPAYLNPAIISGATLVLFYEGEIQW